MHQIIKYMKKIKFQEEEEEEEEEEERRRKKINLSSSELVWLW